MPNDPFAERRLGRTDRALGVVEACERALRGGRAFAAGAKRDPPFVRARVRAAVDAKGLDRELAPRAVERERGALASIEPLAQRLDRLPQRVRPAGRSGRAVPRDAAEALEHVAELVMAELERRRGEEQHPLEAPRE